MREEIEDQAPERFFDGDRTGLAIFRAVEAAVAGLGPAEVRTGRSQVSFRRRRGFAYVWRPSRYLRRVTVPAVLSIALPRKVPSTRFKQVVNPSPGVWMHHLELRAPVEVDAEVVGWLREARGAAGGDRPGDGGSGPPRGRTRRRVS